MEPSIFETQKPAPETVTGSLQNTKLSCFWLTDPTSKTINHPRLNTDTKTDDIVVGGGYTGLWSAIKLKTENPERRVILVEAKRIGWAASGRNGGFCEASITHGEANGLSRWPNEIGTLNRLGHENLQAIQDFVNTNNLDVEFERTGTLSVANEPYQLDWLGEPTAPDAQPRKAGGKNKRPGPKSIYPDPADPHATESVTLTAEQTRARINSPTFLGSEYNARENANVHPAKLARELARHAKELGVEIFEQTIVRKLQEKNGYLHFTTDTGDITAERGILATNAFPSLLKRYALHTVPVYDYVLMTEPLNDKQRESIGWEGREGLADMANQFHYSRLTRDGRILWGGYDAIYFAGGRIRPERENRIQTHEKLASHFFTTFPQLAGLKFTHRWAGVIDTSTRFCAFYGQGYGGRIQYAAGFTGLGVGATHFAADVLNDKLQGRETERTQLEMVRQTPLPFPPEPIAATGINLTRWAMARADNNGGKRNLLLKTLDALGLGFDS